MGIIASKKNGIKKVSTNGQGADKKFVAVRIANEEKESKADAKNTVKLDSSQDANEERTFPHNTDVLSLKPETSQAVLSVLRGDLKSYSTFKAKIVRIFISSTFTDTFVERNALMQDVYPKLKKFCQEHGYEFQVVDMRWGIRAEAMDDHQTLDLCLREIENCQNLSTGPSFLSLLSQKYGFRPIPAKIPKDEFRAIASQIPDESEFQLLFSWYQRDENHRPPVYVLQPISSHIPNFVNYSDEAARKNAVEEWTRVMMKMARILRTAAGKMFLGKERRKYFASVSEAELEKGIFQTNDKTHGCLWFKRNIDGLIDATDEEVDKFIDKQDDENEETRIVLANLHNRILNEMKEENVKQYHINWNSKGINTEDSHHAEYLSQLCKDVFELISKSIEEKINERTKNEANLTIYEEVLQHVAFAKSRCECFHGREKELLRIHEYLEGSETFPLVVYGESGSGKTSVLSMVLKCCQEWFGNEAAVIIRHLGITPDSSLLRRLLLSLCQQISMLLEQDYDTVQRKILKALEDDLVYLIQASQSHFTSEKPLIIILDSLDQLSPEDGAFQLSWLPTKLPPWVKIVISTISQDNHDCLKNIQALIPEHCFVCIPLLPLDDAVQIVNDWLSANKKTLTADQNRILLASFEKCSLPIFLKVSFEEALRWKSYTPKEEIRLECTVRGAINALFERIERQHGNLLVRRTFAYITAAKSGLTESELEDILSCDDEVLEDVYQYWVPPVRRIPPLLWLRMKHDLSSYLVDRGADESMVVTWYHRQFKEAAIERYLSNREETRRVHLAISEFFSGLWANGNQKPFKNKQGEEQFMDRLLAPQDLIFRPDDHCHRGPVSFNFRKLNELPFQLVKSEELNLLKEKCLCNYEFLLTHLRARGLSEVLDNFDLAISVWPQDKDLTTVHETLKLSTNALILWPGQLASQLTSRIPEETMKKSKYLQMLGRQARTPSLSALVPSVACLTSPGGPLLQSLSGSTEPHTSLRLSSDGKTLVSIGEGIQMLLWDIRAGRIVRNIDCPDGGTTYTCMTSAADVIVISRFGIIKAWCISTGQQLLAIKSDEETAPISICVWNGKDALAAFFSEALNIIDLKSGETIKQYCTKIGSYSEKPVKVMLSSWNQKCLVVHKDLVKDSQFSLLLELFDISTECKHGLFRIKTDNDMMSLEIVSCNQMLVASAGMDEDLNRNRRPSARPSIASHWQKLSLELWDMDTMKPKRTLTTETESVRCSCMTPDRNEVIMLCNTNFIETACEFMGFIKIYSVVDGSSVKMPLSYPSAITSVCGTGFRCIVTTSLDKIIRVWDLERSLDLETCPSKETVKDQARHGFVVKDVVVQNKNNLLSVETAEHSSVHRKPTVTDLNMKATNFDGIDAEVVKSSGTSTEQTENNSQVSVNGRQATDVGASCENEEFLNEDATSATRAIVESKERKVSKLAGWRHMSSFPVGKNFLKLRYSNLSSAVHSLVVESGSSLEELQISCYCENMLVYFARRVVDSIYSAVVWNLDTDIKVRISGLQNPEACISRYDCDYLVMISSGNLSVYKLSSGDFVRCKPINVDDDGSERLISLSDRRVLVVEKGRRRTKLFLVPNLNADKLFDVGENAVIVRVFCSRNMEYFVVCIRKPAQSHGFAYVAEVLKQETFEKIATFEYGTYASDFNDTMISDDGATLVDLIFDPDQLQYRVMIWKTKSALPQAIPCDLRLNVFAMQSNFNEIVIGTWNGDLIVCRLDGLTWKRVAKAHSGAIHNVLLSRAGVAALTIAGAFNSKDRSVRLWNIKSGKLITEFTPDVKISALAMTDDERYIILEIQGKLIKFQLLCNNH